MAFTVDCKYDHRAHVVYATFDGVLVSEQEIEQLFVVLEDYVRPLRKPVYLVANFDSWRVETDVMRQYGVALRNFYTVAQTVFVGYSSDIYARMNLRLAAVIGGASPNLFLTREEALAFVEEQQRLANNRATLPRPVARDAHH
jgi:hypothetical protein